MGPLMERGLYHPFTQNFQGWLTLLYDMCYIIILGTVLNRSLTNIQWLKGMQLKEDKPQTTQNQLANQYQNIQWTSLTPSEIMKVGCFNSRNKLRTLTSIRDQCCPVYVIFIVKWQFIYS